MGINRQYRAARWHSAPIATFDENGYGNFMWNRSSTTHVSPSETHNSYLSQPVQPPRMTITMKPHLGCAVNCLVPYWWFWDLVPPRVGGVLENQRPIR